MLKEPEWVMGLWDSIEHKRLMDTNLEKRHAGVHLGFFKKGPGGPPEMKKGGLVSSAFQKRGPFNQEVLKV